MKLLTRTIITLVVINLIIGNFAPAQEATAEPPRLDKESAPQRMVTISGVITVGTEPIQGVMVIPSSGGKVDTTDAHGQYSIKVPYGWKGQLRLMKKGFTLKTKSYPNVVSDLTNQDHVAEIITFIISGRTGLSDVVMEGLPGKPVTDNKGYYRAKVEYGWTGTVIPKKDGFYFEPASMRYSNVVSDLTNNNYISKRIDPAPGEIVSMPTQTGMVTISGRIRVVIDSETVSSLSGVAIEGLPGNPVTDEYGLYSVAVPYGFSSTVRPVKKGYSFVPASINFHNIIKNQDKSFIAKRFSPAPTFARTGSREVLVIPSIDIKSENLVAVTEDLQIMTHIFDEKFKEPQEIQGVFVDFGDIFGRDSRKTEAIYIQGYGALFLMEVNFAFTHEPKTEEKQTEKTEDVDPIWQRTRQKIFSPPGFGDREFETEKKYSADKIEQLKQELTRTLKHTSNIRNINPDEWIILTVIGKARQSGGMYQYNFSRTRPSRTRTSSSRGRSSSRTTRTRSGMYDMGGMGGSMMMGGGSMSGSTGGMGGSMGAGGGFGGGMMMGGGMMGGMGGYMEDYYPGDTGPASATVLTIRVKKSDVDDFAKGELNFEQFQEKVDIFTY